MAPLNHSVREIIEEFNQQLCESMPVGRFVAAALVCLDESTRTGEVWIGGTPGALLLDHSGRKVKEFPSVHMPLGILDNKEIDPKPIEFSWESSSQLILCSDGLIEAENAEGEAFGESGLATAMAILPPTERLDAIRTALFSHLGQAVAADDVSIVLIDCP
jgi:serine phosphatase RsbU (regulator of sigma subunit)